MTKTVKLYNKGKRTITGIHSGIVHPVTGKEVHYSFAPESSAEFDEADANKLRKMFKNEIVSMDDVKRQFEEAPKPSLEDPNAGKFDKIQVAEMIADAVAKALEADRAARADDEDGTESGEDEDEDPEAAAAKAVEAAEKKRAEKEAKKAAKEAEKAAASGK